jgi:cell division protein FtsI (penicillin-binding protein 3)
VVDNNILFTRHRLLLAMVSADKPEIVLMAVLSKPGIEVQERRDDSFVRDFGALIPPVAALQQVMKNLSDMMRPKVKEETNFSRSGEQGHDDEGDSVLQETVSVSVGSMPDLSGMSLRKSLRLLQSTGVKVQVKGTGRVVEQKPSPGTKLSPETHVLIILRRDDVDAEFKKTSKDIQ